MSSNDALAVNAKIARPCGVFVSSNDEVYIADSYNNRIRKVLQNGNIVTIAGNGIRGFSGDNGPATDAQLYNPTGVFVSSNNEVYIADESNNRIRKILQNGNIVTVAGNGTKGFSGDYGPATDAQLYNPTGVFVTDEIYIADESNNRIRKVLENGNIVTVAGNGTKGFSGDNGPATDAQLYNPNGVFVSSNNEVYFSDSSNNRIRKILQNGNIVTVAGNGKCGFSGENGPAVEAQLYNPYGVFVSSNNEIYIADLSNHRIRKVLENGNIITIAGNGNAGFSDGLATSAQLYNPYGVFVTSNNEIYIADLSNHRIRKVLENGNIITIAGNGNAGFSGNCPFDISLYPHFGNSSITRRNVLKKHSRDELFGLEIYGFMPLIERLSLQFSQILKNEKIICSMNASQHSIIQKLIDSLIYDYSQLNFTKNEVLDVLFILGLFKNGEFVELKRRLTSEFFNSITLEEIASEWEKIESLLATCKDFGIENYILECLNNYCTGITTVDIKTTEGSAVSSTLPIVLLNTASFISKMAISQTNPIKIKEKIEVQPQNLESLFNDKKTSDVKIKMGEDKYLYCHKTVLSSTSTFFAALFESGSSFSDLNNGIFTPEESEDLELLEIIIKYCYGISSKIDTVTIIGLLDMAIKHEIAHLVDYCKRLSIDNYFSMVSTCEQYLDLPLFEGFLKEIIRFGVVNKKLLFNDMNTIAKLPEKIWPELIFNLSQYN